MNIELENFYKAWDDSLTHTEGYVFNDIYELTELLQNSIPVRVYPSKNEDNPFSITVSDVNYKHFYKVREIKDKDKGYIIHTEFEPELVGKAGIFCDNLDDIEVLMDPVNFVPFELKNKGTTNFPFYNGKTYYKYFIEIPSLMAFPDDICPLQPGDVIKEKLTSIKYMVIGTDETQNTPLHVETPMTWLNNSELFRDYYKVTEYGDSVIGVIRQLEIV